MQPKDHFNVGNVTKGLILRRNLYVHLQNIFPKISDGAEEFAGFAFYEKHKGVCSDGTKVTAGDDEDDEDGDDEAPAGIQCSVYKSRNFLMKLLDGLARNRYEHTLIDMARTQGVLSLLDLTTPAAKPINMLVNEITTQYGLDFPPTPKTDTRLVNHIASDQSSVSVQVVADDLDEKTYKDKLQIWEQHVADYESEKCTEYLGQHVLEIIVDDMTCADTVASRVEKRLSKAGAGKGVKRKLFVGDNLPEHEVDWKELKRTKKSAFGQKVYQYSRDAADVLMNTYVRNRGCMNIVILKSPLSHTKSLLP